MISIYLFDATCPIPICRFSGADKIIHYENGGDPTFTAGDVTIGLLNGGGILNASAYFMGSYNFPDFAPKVRQFRIVFGTIFRAVLQLHPTPTRAVCDALLGAHADRVLIGAWNLGIRRCDQFGASGLEHPAVQRERNLPERSHHDRPVPRPQQPLFPLRFFWSGVSGHDSGKGGGCRRCGPYLAHCPKVVRLSFGTQYGSHGFLEDR